MRIEKSEREIRIENDLSYKKSLELEKARRITGLCYSKPKPPPEPPKRVIIGYCADCGDEIDNLHSLVITPNKKFCNKYCHKNYCS